MMMREPLPVTADPGLFEALGGRAGVGRIVDGLYDRLERDRELTRLFRSRRKGERDRLKEFFEGFFGGEVRGIRDVGMQRRHVHRLISAEESARWLAHFGAAMDQAGVATGPQAAVMRLLREAAARLENDGAPLPLLRQAMAAAAKGDVDAVAALVADHPRLIGQRSGDGATVLWTAARRGRLPLVRWLTGHGADIEIPGSAVHMTQVTISPYCIAVRSRHHQVARFLLDQGAQVDVFGAAFLGDLDTLRGHIAAGLANAQSPHEDFHPVTPLHHAVDGGSAAAATLLLENGAEPRTAGGRLLTSAANQGSAELVRLLLDHGARARDAESLGPLGTDPAIGRLLVAHGFDLDVPIRAQETPLTRACRADKREHPETVRALLELGADPNAPNARGRTPLAMAAGARFSGTVALLLAAGAR
jgi:ankyrin repeat protein